MRVTRYRMAKYRSEVEQLEDAAAGYVTDYVRAFRATNPDASVAEIREATIEAIGDSLNAFGHQAGELAGELFDEVCASEGIKAQFVTEDVIDPKMIDEGVRYRARELVSGNDPKFAKDVTDLTRFYVKRSAFENMTRNCDRNKVRYARVPSGRETCAFCFMLSSRGFAYHSELTAKGRGLHGMHNHCDCIVVPGIDGKTRIEGYDPDAMYRRWKDCAKAVGEDADTFSYANRQKIMDEVSRRDWKWLYSGTGCDPTFTTSSVERRVQPHELRTAKRLSRDHGLPCCFIQDFEWVVDPTGSKKRVGLPDLEDGTELKAVQESRNALGAMDNYLSNAQGKKGLMRVVVDNTEAKYISDSDIITAAKEVWQHYPAIPAIQVLTKSGNLVLIERKK